MATATKYYQNSREDVRELLTKLKNAVVANGDNVPPTLIAATLTMIIEKLYANAAGARD